MSMNDRLTVEDVINSEFINDRTMIYIDLCTVYNDETVWTYRNGTWFSDRILELLDIEVQEYTYSSKYNGLLIKAIRRTGRNLYMTAPLTDDDAAYCDNDKQAVYECSGDCDHCIYRAEVPGTGERIDREPAYYCGRHQDEKEI